MKKYLFTITALLLLAFGASKVDAQALRVFISAQVGTGPVAGYVLTTDGTNSSWQPAGGGSGSSLWESVGGYLQPIAAYINLPIKVTSVVATSTTATSTFPNIDSSNLSARNSAGVDIHANNGTQVANFGAGGGAGATFSGGVNVNGSTRLATTLNGIATFVNGLVGSTGTTTFYASAYGAVCDNTTDDSTAINNAITAANTNGGGDVMLCSGTSYIANRIVPKSNVALIGQGRDVTTLRGNRASDYVIFHRSSTTQLTNFTLKDLTINVNNVANSSGVEFSNTKDLLVQNVHITNVPTGGWNFVLGSPVSSSTTFYNHDAVISDVIFDNHTGTLEQLLVYNASGTSIVRPIFRNNTAGAGVQVALGLWQWTENTTITDAKFYNNADVCMYYSVTTNNTKIINPTFYGCSTAIQGANVSDNGMFGYNRANGLTIVNPLIVGSTTSQGYGIKLGAVDNASIVNPIITNMQIGIGIGGGNTGASTTSAINWSIINPIIYNNNVTADFHSLHPGIFIENPSNQNLFGSITGGKFYDSSLGNQRYPIVLNGATTFDYLSITNNRLSAATSSGGVSIFLNNSAVVGASTLIKDNFDYSGTNPAQKSTTYTDVGGITAGSILFGSSTGVIAQKNTSFFWNDSLNRLGIGTSTPTAGVSIQSYTGNALLEVGNYNTNDSTTKVLIKNRWTGNDGASLAVRGTSDTSTHFYVGGGGASAFGTTTLNFNSRLTVFGAGSASTTSNFKALNSASTTLFSIDNGGGIYMLGNVGIGTTTPGSLLTVAGTSTLTTTSVSSLSIGSLTGFIKATAGAIATSLINLASDVTGILPVSNGGTGTSTVPTNGQVLSNVSGVPTWVATSSLGIVGSGGAYIDVSKYDYVIRKSGANTIAIDTSSGSTVSTNANADVPIQFAIDALTSGGDILIDKGNYTVATSVAITDNINLTGLGNQTYIKATAGMNKPVLTNKGVFTNATNTNIVVRDIKFDGDKANQTVAFSTIYFAKITNSEISGVTANGALRTGVYPGVLSTWGEGVRITNSRYVKVDKVHAEDNSYDGVKFWGTFHSTLSNSTFVNNGANGFQLAYDTSTPVDSSMYNTVTNITVYSQNGGVPAGSNGTKGFTLDGAYYDVISNVSVYGTRVGFQWVRGTLYNRMNNIVVRPSGGPCMYAPNDPAWDEVAYNSVIGFTCSPLGGADQDIISLWDNVHDNTFQDVNFYMTGTSSGSWYFAFAAATANNNKIYNVNATGTRIYDIGSQGNTVSYNKGIALYSSLPYSWQPWTLGALAYYTATGTVGFVSTTTLVAGTNISFSGGTPVVIGNSPITINASGGSASAGGANGQIQVNSGGTLAGSSTIAVTAINATETQATSSFLGIVNIGTTTQPADPFGPYSLHALGFDNSNVACFGNFGGTARSCFYINKSSPSAATQFGSVTNDNMGFFTNNGTSQLTLSTNGGAAIGGAGYNNTTAPANGLIVQGNVGIGSTTPSGRLTVDTSSLTSPAFWVGSSTYTSLLVAPTGLVGIGSTSPNFALSVTGTTSATGFVGYGLTASGVLLTGAGKNLIATTTSAGLPNLYTDETGTGGAVFATSPTLTTPTFTTRATTAEVAGGSAVSSILTLKSTTGAGNNDSVVIKTGNNGAITNAVFWNNGMVTIGSSTASTSMLSVYSTTTKPALYVNGTTTFIGAVYASSSASSAAAQTGYWCYDANGQFIRTSTACITSAAKYKTGIEDLGLGIADLMKMRFVTYHKVNPLDENDSRTQMGVIADEVAQVSPVLDEMLVTRANTGEIQSFRYDQFTALLGKAIQEQQKQISSMGGAAKRSVEENYQWIIIGLLVVGFLYQQRQINRLKK